MLFSRRILKILYTYSLRLLLIAEEIPVAEETIPIEQLQGYRYLVELEYKKEDIKRAYHANNGEL